MGSWQPDCLSFFPERNHLHLFQEQTPSLSPKWFTFRYSTTGFQTDKSTLPENVNESWCEDQLCLSVLLWGHSGTVCEMRAFGFGWAMYPELKQQHLIASSQHLNDWALQDTVHRGGSLSLTLLIFFLLKQWAKVVLPKSCINILVWEK